MATPVLGTLGPDGWVQTPFKMFDYMLAHFYESDYSQTHLFPGKIASLPWIVRETQGDVSAFCSLCRQTLTSYLSTAFSNVVVEVAEIPTDNTLLASVRMFVDVRAADGSQLNAAKLIRTEGTIVKEIADYIGA